MAFKFTQHDTHSMHVDRPWSGDALPFLKKYFPLQFLILIPLLRRILPEELFLLFMAWKKEQLWKKFIHEASTYLGRTITFRPSLKRNSGIRFFAFRVSAEEEGKARIVTSGQSVRSGDEALSKALGEFFERSAFNEQFNTNAKVGGSVRKKGLYTVDLKHFPLYLPWQKKEVNAHFLTRDDIPSAKVRYVGARSLIRKKYAFVPADRVFWNKSVPEEGEGIVNQGTTNALGGGFTKEQALLSAAYEAIERDSFFCYWLLKLTPRSIDPKTIPIPEVKALLTSTKQKGMEIHFLDITTALGMPAVACVIVRRDRAGILRLGMGAASGHTPERLFLGSLIEAHSVANGLGREDSHVEVSARPFKDRSMDREKRLTLWRAGRPEQEMDWLLTGEKITYEAFASLYGVGGADSEFKLLKMKFHTWVQEYGEGYHPYFYRPKSSTAPFGFHVVAVIVPSLYPIYLHEHFATLDISALHHWKETIKRLGSPERKLEVVNTFPHPFP